MPEGTAVPVTYIGGSQRSGSSLLDRMLGQLPHHLSAGEIVHLWVRGLSSNELCGCGAAFLDCPFWTEVGRVAFGGWVQVRVDDVTRLQRRVDRNRYIIFMLVPKLWPRFERDLRAYAAILERLFGAIGAVAEGATIVDSSKHASTAFLLRRVGGLRLRMVHLVRDSRGVAFSLLKEVPRPEVRMGEEFMHRASPWRSALEWAAFNALFHVLRSTGATVVRVRYEDLVRRPRETLQRIGELEEQDILPSDLAFIEAKGVTLGVDHMVAGNPMRFRHGTFELRLDDAWRRSMRRDQRFVTTLLTWPQLMLYRYRP
jgi:hypothetical protein